MFDIERSIAETKKGFEDSFLVGEFYDRQTKDKEHLTAILNFVNIEPNMRILDLGTGSGYISFAIAEKYPDVEIVGLDIVEETLAKNWKKVAEDKFTNLSFVTYDGIRFPFAKDEFDMVISRYALHHFPDIQTSISEVSRVLKDDGQFFISDPTPNSNDTQRFIDAYMQLKKDGHIKFYTAKEWENICQENGMKLIDSFESEIRFPKKKDTAYGFEELLEQYDKEIIDGYNLKIIGDEIYVTEQVNNLLFCK